MELDGGNEFDMEMLYAIRIDGSWKVQRYLWTLGHRLEVKFRLEWSCRVKKKTWKILDIFFFLSFSHPSMASRVQSRDENNEIRISRD